MRIDTQLFGLGDAADQARRLARLGFDGAFTFEGPHDVFMPLVLAAGAGLDVDLYTNLAIAFPRNPLQVAHLAWDLQALSGGRFALGLGSQIRPQIERRYGAEFSPPVPRMREFIEALRAIFATWQQGSPLAYEGRFYRHTMMPPLFNPGPLACGPPPIWLGALGPLMTRLAAEMADGLAVMPFCSEGYIRAHTLPTVEAGLAAGGRDSGSFTMIGEAIVACGRDEAELSAAVAGVRMLLGFYGSTPAYRPVLDHLGRGGLPEELRALTRAGRWDDLAARVDDDLLHAIAVVGEPAEAAALLAARYGDWADRLCLYTPYAIADSTLAELVTDLRNDANGKP
jgi:probable F420-dependent oxidoreductase